jgi:hypothetical protein
MIVEVKLMTRLAPRDGGGGNAPARSSTTMVARLHPLLGRPRTRQTSYKSSGISTQQGTIARATLYSQDWFHLMVPFYALLKLAACGFFPATAVP